MCLYCEILICTGLDVCSFFESQHCGFYSKAEEDIFSLPTCYFSNGNHKHKLFYSPKAGRQNQREEVTRQLGPDEKIVMLE